jgi:N-acetylmuramoyl-L-alanine amidase
LRAAGIRVDILPATVPTGYNADAFIALHADGNTSSSARGFKISTRWRSEVAVQDARLVEILTENYGAATGLIEDRDNITRNMRGYYAYASWRPNWRISNYTPAAIVEMGFITNAADREFMFSQTNRLVVGITGGILRFLAYAYPAGRPQAYGLGIVDGDINMAAPTFPWRGGGGGSTPEGTPGDWQALIMGPLEVPVYDNPESRNVLTNLPRGRFHHSTLRRGDYYRISLPNGQNGWLHRNVVVIQM